MILLWANSASRVKLVLAIAQADTFIRDADIIMVRNKYLLTVGF